MKDLSKFFIFTGLLVTVMFITIGCDRTKNQPLKQIGLTIEELSKFDGKNGRATYVAVNGIIYDLTKCRYWTNGNHTPANGKAVAGKDLTDILKKSTHAEERIKRYPVVGWLVESES